MDLLDEKSQIKQLLAGAVAASASDLHINVGMPPIMRINTELVPVDTAPVSLQQVRQMMLDMVSIEKFETFEKKRDYDFSTTISDGSRFRVNAHYQRDTIALSFRLIPSQIPQLSQLHLPKIVDELAKLPRGLVLVTGHTGSGKSTTLAAMINMVNSTVSSRIITLEDPVEYVFENNMSMIEQREIGSDCLDFASGLKHALRQDPEVILVGEMRDLETTGATITAAETGHLVLSTLHTINATQTVERIIDIYPAAQQNQIRTMLANTLHAVISQTLFKRIDQSGMVPAVEILLCNSAVRNCIRENRIYEIPNIIATSRKIGMQEMDNSIAEMYFKGFIGKDDAIDSSTNPSKMEKTLSPDNKATFLKNMQGQ
ncbi:MAG TPA: type IV pili twitching motility protein PilT [Phycisphaerales bacterium]|nr:type IV pili twitching motility protein PilT [Phycisphaerales bacterium]HBR19930.1 type IV pili twitching motility protein PilT [Phycisphaerales bacterium]